jgi:hypothetical protein
LLLLLLLLLGYNAVYAQLNASFPQRKSVKKIRNTQSLEMKSSHSLLFCGCLETKEALKAIMMPPAKNLCTRSLSFLKTTPLTPLQIVAALRPMLAYNPECQYVVFHRTLLNLRMYL